MEDGTGAFCCANRKQILWEIMDSLQDHILLKKILANIKPVRFCPQRYWVMIAIPTIV